MVNVEKIRIYKFIPSNRQRQLAHVSSLIVCLYRLYKLRNTYDTLTNPPKWKQWDMETVAKYQYSFIFLYLGYIP